jgi:transcription initiation factor TFIIIB Brf1 subunit/transcription initiation factor TFIIB
MTHENIEDTSQNYLANYRKEIRKRSLKNLGDDNYTNNNDTNNNNDDNIDENIDVEEKCDKCSSTDLVERGGFITCRDCGCQLDTIIKTTPEWRDYGQNDGKKDQTRCGMPTNVHMPNLYISSVFGQGGKDSYQMRRLRTMQTWNSVSYKDGTVMKSFMEMDNVCGSANIKKNIVQDAKTIFNKIYNIKSHKKTKKRTLQATSVLFACRQQGEGIARGTDEIGKIFGISNKEMRKGIKFMENMLYAIGFDDDEDFKLAEHRSVNSIDYLHRCCSKLNISDGIYLICKSVCSYVEEKRILSNHVPLSRTASIIYFVISILEIDLNKTNIGDACGISDVTINECYQKLTKDSKQIINATALKNYVSSDGVII